MHAHSLIGLIHDPVCTHTAQCMRRLRHACVLRIIFENHILLDSLVDPTSERSVVMRIECIGMPPVPRSSEIQIWISEVPNTPRGHVLPTLPRPSWHGIFLSCPALLTISQRIRADEVQCEDWWYDLYHLVLSDFWSAKNPHRAVSRLKFGGFQFQLHQWHYWRLLPVRGWKMLRNTEFLPKVWFLFDSLPDGRTLQPSICLLEVVFIVY